MSRTRGLATAAFVLLIVWPGPRARGESGPGSLVAAAREFLATLSPAQLVRAKLAFDADVRFRWRGDPGVRDGLPLKEMSSEQQRTALRFLEASLSEKGLKKVRLIRALERRLARLAGDGAHADPDLYFFLVFGEPADSGAWGWRFEGHNVSLNWTVVDGRMVSGTPQFLGAEPAEVREGPLHGARVLGAEDDLARALFRSLGDGLRREAAAGAAPPREFLTGTSRIASRPEETGVSWTALTREQQGMLLSLIEEHAGLQPKELSDRRLERIRGEGLDGVRFSLIGGLEKDSTGYYRVQGPGFAIEYACTEENGGRARTVFREFDRDWGHDVLSTKRDASPTN
ncbi:MAG: DUF3500 domain-containing protein [Thermoanaerobaculia bacterium]